MSRVPPSDPFPARAPAELSELSELPELPELSPFSAPSAPSAPSACVRHRHLPGPSVPEPRGVPAFDPLRPHAQRDRLRRAVLRRRRVMAAGLAVTAAALAAASARGATDG
ncbi:hypothetical protein L1885_10465, partial [Streptomyces fuscigenes]|nr:hypothetical protein [Streptomyces fuscigenes]